MTTTITTTTTTTPGEGGREGGREGERREGLRGVGMVMIMTRGHLVK